jgi:orotate phosphoribosyltransferase
MANNSASYLATVINAKSRRLILSTTIAICRRIIGVENFSYIACRGFSGSLIAPSVADTLDKSLLAVRKSTGDCHSSYCVEAPAGEISGEYIIIDDTIATGKTMHAICDDIHQRLPDLRCVGIILYAHSWRANQAFGCGQSYSIPVFNFHYSEKSGGMGECIRTDNVKITNSLDNIECCE